VSSQALIGVIKTLSGAALGLASDRTYDDHRAMAIREARLKD